MHRLLTHPRGGVAADLDALAVAVAGLSMLVVELGEALEAIEINPVMCTPTGAVAVDVHVELRSR
jgi:hypothetical protein